MDVLVLLGSFAVLCALSVPVAYALGLRRSLRRLDRHPAGSGDVKISDGTDDSPCWRFHSSCWGRIMAEGGMPAA